MFSAIVEDPLTDMLGAEVLAVLRALAVGALVPGDLLDDPPEGLLLSLEREGLLAHLDLDGKSSSGHGLARAARDAAREAAQRNLAGLATLAVVHRAFDRAGIEHLGFKGPVSNQALYDTRVRRVYGDVDILVRREDRDRAAAVLLENSFRSSPTPGLGSALARRVHFHSAFGPPPNAGLLPVELHWELIDRVNLLRVDLDPIFAAVERQTVAGMEVPILDRGAHLVYLCCHLKKHGPLIRWGLKADRPAEWFGREERGYPLAWLVDLHHAFVSAADRLGPLDGVVAAWNAMEDVEDCVRLLDRMMPSERRSAAIARLGLTPNTARATPSRVLATLLESTVARRAVARGVRLDAAWSFRPIRWLDLPRVLAPSPRRLRAFHLASSNEWTSLPRLYARHFIAIVRRLFDLRPPSRSGQVNPPRPPNR